MWRRCTDVILVLGLVQMFDCSCCLSGCQDNASKLLLALMESRHDSENAERILFNLRPRELVRTSLLLSSLFTMEISCFFFFFFCWTFFDIRHVYFKAFQLNSVLLVISNTCVCAGGGDQEGLSSGNWVWGGGGFSSGGGTQHLYPGSTGD